MAAMTIPESVFTDENQRLLEERTQNIIPSDPAAKMKEGADRNGITPAELASSPNRKQLIEEYEFAKLVEGKNAFQEILGVTDKQAWAGIAAAMGLI